MRAPDGHFFAEKAEIPGTLPTAFRTRGRGRSRRAAAPLATRKSRKMARANINPKYHVGLGAVTAVELIERGVLLTVGEERFRAEVIRADVLRLKISRSAEFDESPTFAAAFTLPEPVPFQVTEDELAITLVTAQLRLVITRAPFGLAAHRSDGSVVFEDVLGEDGGSRGYVHL